MARFSNQSLQNLSSCHEDLQVLFNEVILHFDCSVLCGFRNEAEQTEAFISNHSKLNWPNSKHNKSPSMAIDVSPYPVDWQDREQFYLFAGYVLATAEQLYQIGAMGRRVRWGGDWDSDKQLNDDSFADLLHFELMAVIA